MNAMMRSIAVVACLGFLASAERVHTQAGQRAGTAA